MNKRKNKREKDTDLSCPRDFGDRTAHRTIVAEFSGALRQAMDIRMDPLAASFTFFFLQH